MFWVSVIYMAITREQKETIVEQVTDTLNNSTSVVFVSFNQLNANEDCEFRRQLRDKGMKFNVIKKKLLYRGFDNTKIEGDMLDFDGEVGMISGTSEDPTELARTVKDLVKEKKLPVVMLGGVYENTYTAKDTIQDISEIPSIEVLRAKLAFLLKSPITRFAICINELSKTK